MIAQLKIKVKRAYVNSYHIITHTKNAHGCCDVADGYIETALRDDSSEDDTWRFALDNEGDAYYRQHGW